MASGAAVGAAFGAAFVLVWAYFAGGADAFAFPIVLLPALGAAAGCALLGAVLVLMIDAASRAMNAARGRGVASPAGNAFVVTVDARSETSADEAQDILVAHGGELLPA
jgi:hypothetical protein